ncbi:MAG: NAD(P)H-dependent glycerol-3-phosphate dehydrogenase [Candidatus Bipolaricaulia bacterium]
MRVSVIGAGSWGTAFSRLTATSGHSTVLWSRKENQAQRMRNKGENEKYLPGASLPEENFSITTDISKAVSHGEVIFLAVPSFAVREVASRVAPHIDDHTYYLVNLAKGFEKSSFKTMSEVLREEVKGVEVFTLSGPSHAEEVAAGDPTAVILAGDLDIGRELQEELSTGTFRIYLSSDIGGVEYCGGYKNIIAIASGIARGLGYGDNTTSALISRGLAEMVKFGRSMGARKETFFGLAGVGDLVATCTSEHSRNRSFGVKVGKGQSVEVILDKMDMVVEGVFATRNVHQLCSDRNIPVPITDSLYRIIEEESSPSREVKRLMSREFKVEDI